MSNGSGSELGALAAQARAAELDRRVRAAIALCQMFLVIRIMSVLLGVGLLPPKLPTVTIRLDPSHVAVLPLGWLNQGTALLAIAAVSAIELYLVFRLADRRRLARFAVLLIESAAILGTATALALGAAFAILPLATSAAGTCLLLLNQVRWAFRLQPAGRHLTGRRQGGVFAGYAAPPIDGPKPPQTVGYRARPPHG
ncbi:MAG TPA: hypothetical protein VEK76_11595 [Candidatus Binatia bacterium]|nr:hypothetical protein [Candidatus Binatia bacterium]